MKEFLLRPSTLLTFHQALVRRKYRRLFSSTSCPRKPGPKGPDQALIQTIVELKSRNPRFGCPRIARIIAQTFGIDIDKNVVYRALSNQAYYNAARGHASLEGHTPLTFVDKHAVAPADLSHVRWVSHCRELVQLPVAA